MNYLRIAACALCLTISFTRCSPRSEVAEEKGKVVTSPTSANDKEQNAKMSEEQAQALCNELEEKTTSSILSVKPIVVTKEIVSGYLRKMKDGGISPAAYGYARYTAAKAIVQAADRLALAGVTGRASADDLNRPKKLQELAHELAGATEQEKAEYKRVVTVFLHEEIQQGSEGAVYIHLELGPDLNGGTSTGMTPLLRAILIGNTKIITALIDAGADVNLKVAGASPLHVAAGLGNNEVVRLLIKKGADVKAKTDKGLDAIAVAEAQNQFETAAILKGITK